MIFANERTDHAGGHSLSKVKMPASNSKICTKLYYDESRRNFRLEKIMFLRRTLECARVLVLIHPWQGVLVSSNNYEAYRGIQAPL